jgi:hypothetical protein
MKSIFGCAIVVMLAGCSERIPSSASVVETQSVGDPQNGFPSPDERALFMAANRTRSDPSTVKGPSSTIYPAAAPLMVHYDLERSSRFHSTMLATGHAPLMHESPCTLDTNVGTSGCDGTPSCGCQGGVTCNSCGTCAAGTGPFDRIAYFYSGGGDEGEIIAAGYGDPWSVMDGFVDEAAGSDGHRQIVTSASYTVAGFGHADSPAGACWGTFDAGDFGGAKVAAALIPSAAPKPVAGAAGTFRVYATWADPAGGAPASLRAVVDGACTNLVKELGDPKLNSTWYADVPLTNGCHSVYILGQSASGTQASYPATTAFTINVGNSANCAASVAQPVASCGTQPPPPADMAVGPDLATTTPPPADMTVARDLALPPNADVHFVDRNAAKCLDISSAGTADGTKIQQWTCNGTVAQVFQLKSIAGGAFNLVNPNSGKCVDVSGSGTADGTKIQIWDCNNTGAQSFRLTATDGDYATIVNTHSGKCLDVNGVGSADGTPVYLHACDGGTNQQWLSQAQ